MLGNFFSIIQHGDDYFNLFYHSGKEVDQIVGEDGFSNFVTGKVIYNNFIFPEIHKAEMLNGASNWKISNDADWDGLYQIIKQKTDPAFAQRNILNAKVKFYRDQLYNSQTHNSNEQYSWGKKYVKVLVEAN